MNDSIPNLKIEFLGNGIGDSLILFLGSRATAISSRKFFHHGSQLIKQEKSKMTEPKKTRPATDTGRYP